MRKNRRGLRGGLGLLTGILAAGVLAEPTSPREQVYLAPVTVTGWKQDPSLLPGSVSLVTAQEMERIQPRSTEDVLRRVPGVFVKGEEENAIVTNISVRGLPAGDYKTLVLLDGVPVQPGIFVGNSRYYNPRVHRMSGVEVLKGASSLRYGPNTIGGVINFVSRMPEEGVSVTGQAGSWNSRQMIVEAGGGNEAGDARVGVIAMRSESDGFMDKGVETTDVMVRAETAIGDNQFIGVKFLYYDTEANISYRGLFPEAYQAGKRFNPAPDDFFLTERKAFDVVHEWQISPDLNLQTLVYWSEMFREYWRFQLDGNDPTTRNADGFRVWNYGDQVQGNNRYFTRKGVDSRLTFNHGLFGLSNESEMGLRYMEEDMLDQTVPADRATPRNPNQTLTRNRFDSAQSLAFYVQNRFEVTEALSVTGGVRVESYEQKRDDLSSARPTDSFSNTEVMPGLGAIYRISDTAQLFGSVYRAFAPPLVGSVVGRNDGPTDAETSVNLELGIRGRDGRLRYELTAFQMDFSNQVDPGVSGIRNPNEGSALIQGLEAAAGYSFGNGFLLDGNITWIPTAEFGEDRPGDALKGNRLPYSAEWTGNLTLAYEQGRFQTALLFNYVGETFGDGMNVRELTTESTGTWGGRMPGYFTLDLTGRYAVSENLSVFGSVNNLTDELYIAGLRQGIYVGPERNFTLGAKYSF